MENYSQHSPARSYNLALPIHGQLSSDMKRLLGIGQRSNREPKLNWKRKNYNH